MVTKYIMSLAQVGLPGEFRQINFKPSLLRGLTTGRLPEPHIHTVQQSLTQIADITTEHIVPLKIEVCESVGRGLGLFAVDRILAYTRIIEDDALLSLSRSEDLPQLWEKYCLLPPELKQQFDELSFSTEQASKEETLIPRLRQRGYGNDEAERMARVSSRFQANAFKTGNMGRDTGEDSSPKGHTWAYSLFTTVARTNHRYVKTLLYN